MPNNKNDTTLVVLILFLPKVLLLYVGLSLVREEEIFSTHSLAVLAMSLVCLIAIIPPLSFALTMKMLE